MRLCGMTAAALEEKVTASDPIVGGDSTNFVRAGYPPTDALVLERPREVDLHLATRLLRDG
jgi:hypothetical protein